MKITVNDQDYVQLNELLQSVIDIFPGNLSVIDPAYNLVHTNLKNQQEGFGTKSLIGDKCYRHCEYLQNSPDECFAKKVYSTGKPVMGEQLQMNDGRWVEVNCLPLKNEKGETRMVVEFISDITHHKRTEFSLKENEERWQLALEGNNDGIWDWNITTNEMFFSDRWAEMLGYAPGELKSVFATFSNLVHPQDIGLVMKVLQDHMARKSPHFSLEYRMLKADGQFLWVHGRAQAIWNEQGSAVRMTGSHTDITERKIREQEINYLTFHDKLTNLYNRAYFDDAMNRLNTQRQMPLSIIIGDLNGLKITND
ncbi:MAG: PAS domain-containing protein, partial [Bacillota bacterium]|nr:PAS domain-containing protein [Bacillota bacterium]